MSRLTIRLEYSNSPPKEFTVSDSILDKYENLKAAGKTGREMIQGLVPEDDKRPEPTAVTITGQDKSGTRIRINIP
jgi:hypothetical protein